MDMSDGKGSGGFTAVRTSARRRVAGVPDPVDIHVGQRVRLRRTLLGLSQDMLGAAIGLTFQQIQKYERGANRMGASRLYDLAQVLDVPVGYFFEDMPADVRAEEGETAPVRDVVGRDRDPFTRRQTLELVRAFYAIPGAQVQRALYLLVREMAHARASGGGRNAGANT